MSICTNTSGDRPLAERRTTELFSRIHLWDELYSVWRLQSELYLMLICRERILVRRVTLEFWKGLRYDFQVGQLAGSLSGLEMALNSRVPGHPLCI